MRIVALTCEVLARAVYLSAARSPNVVDVRLNRRGLHDVPSDLRAILQDEIDAVGAPYDAVVLAYGLCGGGSAGLRATNVPLVVPRAHDCITLFLGDRERYKTEATAHPGTFWYVQDYLERADDGPFAGLGATSDAAARATHAEYVRLYGKDNADYLMEVMGAWRDHYDRAAFVDIGIGDASATLERARTEATARDWTFASMEGSLVLIKRLIDADWDPRDFLTLQPGERLAMSYDDDVVRAVGPDEPSS
jgi:Protein of unknown function (DUF1638)